MSNLTHPGSPQQTTIARQGFGSQEIERRGEKGSSALIAQARAEVEARYVVAYQRPRNEDNVRVKLIHECKRPSFAEAAFYAVPRKGAGPGRITGRPGVVEGLSVRFAEAAIRHWTNVHQPSQAIYEDESERVVRVAAVDLEANVSFALDVTVKKTQERRQLRDGQVMIAQRQNSAGETVYIVSVTDEELLQKQNALVSRALRTLSIRLIPGDIIDECTRQIVATRKDETAKDPDAARKRLIDSFAALGVLPEALAEYLGQELAACTVAQIEELRGLFAALRDGDLTWGEAIATARAGRDGAPEAEKTKDGDSKASKIVTKIREKAAKAAQKKEPPAPATTVASGTTKAPESSKPETKAEPAKAGDATPPVITCVVCKKPIHPTEAVETTDDDDLEAWRHATCTSPERSGGR